MSGGDWQHGVIGIGSGWFSILVEYLLRKNGRAGVSLCQVVNGGARSW